MHNLVFDSIGHVTGKTSIKCFGTHIVWFTIGQCPLFEFKAVFVYILLFEILLFSQVKGGHGGRVVTLSPPTSEAGVRSPS